MAIQRKNSTPTTDRPATDLSAGLGAGAPTPGYEAYDRKVNILCTHSQYDAIEQAAADRGYPRHGAVSRIVREAVAKDVGFEL